MANKIETVAGLLKKMGVDVPEAMSLERMTQKLAKRWEKGERPKSVTPTEEALLIELNLNPSTTPDAPADVDAPPAADDTDSQDSADEKPAKAKKGKKAGKDKPAKKAPKERGDTLLSDLKAMFAKRKAIPRAEVRETLIAKYGDSRNGTLNNYLWKMIKGGDENKLGMTLKQEKNKDGKLVLSKIG